MKLQLLYLTDNVCNRWRSLTETNPADIGDEPLVFAVGQPIFDAVKRSRVIHRSEPLPWMLTRVDNTTYSYGDGLVFVLEAHSPLVFTLVTVLNEDSSTRQVAPRFGRSSQVRPLRNRDHFRTISPHARRSA